MMVQTTTAIYSCFVLRATQTPNKENKAETQPLGICIKIDSELYMKNEIHALNTLCDPYSKSQALNDQGTEYHQTTGVQVVTKRRETDQPKSRLTQSFENMVRLDFIHTYDRIIPCSFFHNRLFFFCQAKHVRGGCIGQEEEDQDTKENGERSPDDIRPPPGTDAIRMIDIGNAIGTHRAHHRARSVTEPKKAIGSRLLRPTVDGVEDDE